MSDPKIVDLFLDLQERQLVQGPSSSAPLTGLSFFQGDGYLLRLNGLQPVTDASSLAVYSAVAISYPTLFAALVFVNAPPKSGTWKVKYGADTTAELAYDIDPSDLESAVNALASVASNGGLRMLAIEGRPVNEWVYQWVNDGATGLLEIVSNKVEPLCLTEVAEVPGIPGQYFMKLSRAPIAMSDNFENPMPPIVTVARVVNASAARNEVQRITIPSDASGQFALVFNGGGTPLFSVGTVTAAEIESALDGLFTETGNIAVKAQATAGVYDVTFQGALASTPQDLLGVEMYDQNPQGAPTARMIVPNVPVDLELLGAENKPIDFQITARDGVGEKIVMARIQISLRGDAIPPGGETQLEQMGAVRYVDRTVYVPESMGSPVISASAGTAFPLTVTPPTTVFEVTHNLNTWAPVVTVHFKQNDSPEEWRELFQGGEYEAVAISENAVRLTFGTPISGTAGPYHYSNFKLFIYSPDSTIQLAGHKHTWDEILSALPDGQTLREKLDELSAAVGVVDGAFKLAAASLQGKLTPAQIDLAALSLALQTESTFLETLRVLGADANLVDTIAKAMGNSAEFLKTLEASFSNSEVVTALAEGLMENATFSAKLLEMITTVLQSGGVLPPGSIVYQPPDFSLLMPPPDDLTFGTVTYREYKPLSPAVVVYSDEGNISGELPLYDDGGKAYTVDGGANCVSQNGRRGEDFAHGALITFAAGHWYETVEIGDALYAKECERTLLLLHITADELYKESQFLAAFTPAMALPGNVSGQVTLVVETGAPVAAEGGSNIQSIEWTEVHSRTVLLSPVAVLATIQYRLKRDALGVLTASVNIGGADQDTAPPGSLPVSFRVRITQFDCEDVADPRGALSVSLPAASVRASIAPI